MRLTLGLMVDLMLAPLVLKLASLDVAGPDNLESDARW